MIGNRQIADLRAIVAAGASLDVNGNSYSADDLKSLAAALVKGATLRIRNSGQLSTAECQAIARAKPGQVMLG